MKQNNSKKSGFLLIEMLVAVFIFTIVMLLSITAVLSIVDANRKNQSMKSVINNLNLVINGMAKNIAVSKYYYCGVPDPNYPNGYLGSGEADCATSPGSQITFFFQDPAEDGTPHVVRYSLGAYHDSSGNEIAGSVERSIDGADPIPVTSPEVNITSLKFYVFDTEPLTIESGGNVYGTTAQPRVVMVIRGYAGNKESIRTQFNIQTTVSQRALDVVYK